MVSDSLQLQPPASGSSYLLMFMFSNSAEPWQQLTKHMCPPSSSSSSSISSTMHTIFGKYKLATADKSQVCDGRNLESALQMFKSAEHKAKDKEKVVDINYAMPNKKLEMSGNYSPTPTSCSSSRSKTKTKTEQNKKQQQPQGNQDQEDQERQDPLAKPKARSFLPNPFSTESDDVLDDNNFLLLDNCEAFMQDERRPASPEVMKSAKERPRQHEARDIHSTQSPSNQQRATSGGSPGSRVTMRRLSEPMHRCSVTNASVSGIIRPPRYTSNNLSATADTGMCFARDFRSNKHIRKSTSTSDFFRQSLLSKMSLLSDGKCSDDLSKPTRTFSLADIANATWSSNATPIDQESKEEWATIGVAFSKSIEVYVFKK